MADRHGKKFLPGELILYSFVKDVKRCFLCLSLKQLIVEAARICIGREFQYFTHAYTILCLSDVELGFGKLKRRGLRVFLEKILETGDLMIPLQIFQRKLPCLYFIISKNGKILCFTKSGLVSSYLFLNEMRRIEALTFKSIGLIVDG